MIARALFCILLALSITDAVVEFRDSKIYDEFDFKGQSTVTVNFANNDANCGFFASITSESQQFASKLLVQTPKGFISVADIAAMADPTTGLKSAFIVNKTSVDIVNANTQSASGPLVLYAIRNYYYTPGMEVYEAENLRRAASGNIVHFVTVMSARPFTLRGLPQTGALAGTGQGVVAKMAGYDNLEEEDCPTLYSEINAPFPGFTMEVNGPIVSLGYLNDKYPPGELSATLGITYKRQLERSGWVGSPGYHGCPGQQPYRSSLYDFSKPINAEISNYYHRQDITVGVETNSENVVTLTDAGGEKYSVTKTAPNMDVVIHFQYTSNVTINWTPDATGNTGFLARWRSVTAAL